MGNFISDHKFPILQMASVWLVEIVPHDGHVTIAGIYDDKSRASIAAEIARSAILAQLVPADVRIRTYPLNKLHLP